jgi:hypothetical protein
MVAVKQDWAAHHICEFRGSDRDLVYSCVVSGENWKEMIADEEAGEMVVPEVLHSRKFQNIAAPRWTGELSSTWNLRTTTTASFISCLHYLLSDSR